MKTAIGAWLKAETKKMQNLHPAFLNADFENFNPHIRLLKKMCQ
jgi:hypothetical protein